MVGLCDVRLQSARAAVDIFTVVRGTGAVYIEARENFGNRLVDTENNLRFH